MAWPDCGADWQRVATETETRAVSPLFTRLVRDACRPEWTAPCHSFLSLRKNAWHAARSARAQDRGRQPRCKQSHELRGLEFWSAYSVRRRHTRVLRSWCKSVPRRRSRNPWPSARHHAGTSGSPGTTRGRGSVIDGCRGSGCALGTTAMAGGRGGGIATVATSSATVGTGIERGIEAIEAATAIVTVVTAMTEASRIETGAMGVGSRVRIGSAGRARRENLGRRPAWAPRNRAFTPLASEISADAPDGPDLTPAMVAVLVPLLEW